MSSRRAKGVVRLPGEGEWRQQGVDLTRSGDNKGPGSGFLSLRQVFVGGKLLHVSLVLIICPSKFGFSDKCVKFIVFVEKLCQSSPASSEPDHTSTERFHQFFCFQ